MLFIAHTCRFIWFDNVVTDHSKGCCFGAHQTGALLSPKTSVCEKRNREPKDRRAHDQVGCNTGTSSAFTPTTGVVGLRVAALRWPFGGYRELEGGPLAEWRR